MTDQSEVKKFTCPKCSSVEFRTFKRKVKLPGKGKRHRYEWIDPSGNVLWFHYCWECYRAQRRASYHSCNRVERQRKRFETKRGYLFRCYYNMKARCVGRQNTEHIYKGLIYPKTSKEFIDWGLKQKSFHKLYAEYLKNKKLRRFAPSIDRIDASRGYEFDNLQWLSNLDNIKKSHAYRKECKGRRATQDHIAP